MERTSNPTSTILGVIIILLLIIGGIFYFSQKPPAATDQTLSDSTNTTGATTTGGTVNNPQAPISNPPVTRTPDAPKVTTGQTAFPTDTAVTVTGGVVPNGALTTYWFEYGTGTNVSARTSTQTVGTGYSQIPTPAHITGLKAETKYYYQLVAQNQFGKVTGAQYSFQTTKGTPARVGSIPTVRTTSANAITNTSANLNGAVDPNRDATTYWFEYGKTANLGDTTTITSVGAGTESKPVTQPVSNLEPGTTYYFRINAQNDFGTVNGKILTFKTSGNKLLNL